jgi:hypothetical protein
MKIEKNKSLVMVILLKIFSEKFLKKDSILKYSSLAKKLILEKFHSERFYRPFRRASMTSTLRKWSLHFCLPISSLKFE